MINWDIDVMFEDVFHLECLYCLTYVIYNGEINLNILHQSDIEKNGMALYFPLTASGSRVVATNLMLMTCTDIRCVYWLFVSPLQLNHNAIHARGLNDDSRTTLKGNDSGIHFVYLRLL